MPLLPVVANGCVVGRVDASRARELARFPDVFDVDRDAVRIRDELSTVQARSDALDTVARALAEDGRLTRWRNERYAVAPVPGVASLFLLERAAARYFGIATQAAHLNAITSRDGERCMWIARRSVSKSIDPGLLDNLVGGGIATGATIAGTIVKEAWEEAGIPQELAATARLAGAVHIFRAQPDGIQDETIHVHDVDLPAEFTPVNQDGEVSAFRLETIARVAELAGNDSVEDVVTADAALVIVDWLLRHGQVPQPAFAQLDRLRSAGPPGI
jgi:8-oxo-dGTP pyrophosphatase MutT (NUDIX family)